MDYRTIRARLESKTGNVATDRQILTLIAIALMDLGEAVAHMSATLEHIDHTLTELRRHPDTTTTIHGADSERGDDDQAR